MGYRLSKTLVTTEWSSCSQMNREQVTQLQRQLDIWGMYPQVFTRVD